MINQIKLALILILLSLHVDAFDTFVHSAYKQDSELNKLKKQYALLKTQITKNKLEDALIYGHNNKTALHMNILEKEKTIVLGTLARYLTVNTKKKINLLYDGNNKIQKHKYNKSLSNFKNYTGLDFKNINLEKQISTITLPKNSDIAYKLFTQLSVEEKQAISNVLKIADTKKVFLYLRSSYNQYINMLNNLEATIDTINNTKEKSALTQVKHIQQDYNVIFKKCKILFVIGALKNQLHKPILTTKSMQLKRIHFGDNSSEVSSYSIRILERHAKKLLKLKNFILELHGYSDNFGDKKEKYRLSRERVENTKETLVKFGLDPNKIKLFYYGDKNPIRTNETKQGRLLNRRVEFKVIKEYK